VRERAAGDAGLLAASDATDEIIKDGWLHTGDIAVMDEEGFLRIVDRKKDMIWSPALTSIRMKSKMWSCSTRRAGSGGRRRAVRQQR
jgi:hypothetical protein